LRCGCCHNPDTWECAGGTVYTPDKILARVRRFREYFAHGGGITCSGGEPLLQADFVRELFRLCHEDGINTCLDTSGSILNESVKELLRETDRVLLDIKYTSDEDYKKYVGCSMEKPLQFLDYLSEQKTPVTLRQVIIPTLNDNEENVRALKRIAEAHPNVDGIELLPFRKICQVKYDKMEIPFRFGHLPEPSHETMTHLEGLLKA
ncbi:MAG: radical SAM protein, partial [Clostridia bacterium]|nr:radical SAM protein [Clostridia bacterium]